MSVPKMVASLGEEAPPCPTRRCGERRPGAARRRVGALGGIRSCLLRLLGVPGDEHRRALRRRTRARSSSGRSAGTRRRSASAAARRIGQGESEGISSVSSHVGVDGASWPASRGRGRAPSRPRSRRRRSTTRSSLVPHRVGARDRRDDGEVVGRRRRAVVAHSSVAPSNGSGPTGAPRKRLTARLTATSSRPSAQQVGADRLEQVPAGPAQARPVGVLPRAASRPGRRCASGRT